MASSTKLGEVFVGIIGKDMGLKAALGAAETETAGAAGRMTASMASVAATMGKVFLALGAVGLMKKGIENVEKWEARQTDLISALNQTGDATQANLKHLNDYAKGLGKATAIGKGSILEGMAYAKSLGVQTENLDAAAKAAIGLSARYKIDLEQAFKLVGKAASGETGTLKRFGIIIDDTKDKSQKFAEVLKLGADSFHYAEAQASTTSGTFKKLQLTIEGIATNIGFALIPILEVLLAIIGPIVQAIAGLGETFWKVVTGIAAGVGAIAGIIKLVSVLKKMWEGVTAAVSSAKAAMQDWKSVALALAAITAVSVAFSQFSKSQDDNLDELLQKYQKAAKAAGEVHTKSSSEAVITAEQKKAEEDRKKAADKAWEERKEKLKDNAQKLFDVVKATRAAREAEQERRRDAIGWTGAADVWRNAAVMGERERFWRRPEGGMFSPWQQHGVGISQFQSPVSQHIPEEELRQAMRKMNEEQAESNRYLRAMASYLDPSTALYASWD